MITNVLPPFPNYPHPRPQYPPQAAYHPKPPAQPIQLRSHAPQTNPRTPRNLDPPLPLPLSEIYRYLLVGYSTNNCGALRGRVQALIRNGWLQIEGNCSLPNVTSNPLPNHDTGNGVNVIEPWNERSILEINQMIPNFNEIFAIAVKEGYVCPQGSGSGSDRHNSGCPYHGGTTGHELQNCDEFRQEVWRMLSLRILRCQRRSRIEDEVNTARFGRDTSTPNPRIVFSAPNTPTPLVPPITIIRTPPLLPVTNTHAMSWNYNIQVFTQNASCGTSISTLNHTYTQPITSPKLCFAPHEHFKMTYIGPSNNTTPQPKPKPVTTSNSLPQDQEVEFITRSGRSYENDETEKKKGKVKMGVSPENMEEGAVRVEKGESSEKKEEEELLLQIMKQSEYDAFVTPDITPGQFEKIVGQIQASNFVTFLEDKVDLTGLKHTKALHVTVKCKRCIVAKVLIDNGSALNVLPNATLAKLLVNLSAVRQSVMVVRAFDGTKRELDSMSEALISPIAEGQELDNWEAEDIPMLNLK
ncbi:uncharacterized protein LOC110668821 [Hevea brasiliensis]|uniref:uncharacterized protein LOC110668821 n=1 Tax=Hevea brasiliensis TaxID=3981 RepID=UPI0025F8EB45|nr:uncharacterized protein LOC110668821 [Hevea brasiliensis]